MSKNLGSVYSNSNSKLKFSDGSNYSMHDIEENKEIEEIREEIKEEKDKEIKEEKDEEVKEE